MAFGDLPVLPKKQRSSIRRATPQVQAAAPCTGTSSIRLCHRTTAYNSTCQTWNTDRLFRMRASMPPQSFAPPSRAVHSAVSSKAHSSKAHRAPVVRPQVQSMSASMKRASREKVVPSSRSSSFASEAISE